MADNGVTCSKSRSGNVWDNAAMESFFSSLKTERVKRKVYRSRDQARADVFDYIERFYNPTRRHSTNGYLGPMQYEERATKALVAVHETGSSSCGSFAKRVVQGKICLQPMEFRRRSIGKKIAERKQWAANSAHRIGLTSAQFDARCPNCKSSKYRIQLTCAIVMDAPDLAASMTFATGHRQFLNLILDYDLSHVGEDRSAMFEQ